MLDIVNRFMLTCAAVYPFVVFLRLIYQNFAVNLVKLTVSKVVILLRSFIGPRVFVTVTKRQCRIQIGLSQSQAFRPQPITGVCF
jgi:hypothetical protein